MSTTKDKSQGLYWVKSFHRLSHFVMLGDVEIDWFQTEIQAQAFANQLNAAYQAGQADRDELVKALEDFLANDRIKLCDMLSHNQQGDLHKPGEACPPLARIEALLTRITNP